MALQLNFSYLLLRDDSNTLAETCYFLVNSKQFNNQGIKYGVVTVGIITINLIGAQVS